MAENTTVINITARDETKAAFDSVERNFKKVTAASDNSKTALDRGARQARQGVAQLGHQIQDVAVMLQAGQNPFIILAQQGSQILSIMGAGGAIAGAAVAVSSIFAMTLMPTLFDSKAAIDELNKGLEELSKLSSTDASTGVMKLSEDLMELARLSEVAARTQMAESIRLRTKELEAAVESLNDEKDKIIRTIGPLIERAAIGRPGEAGRRSAERLAASFGIDEESIKQIIDSAKAAFAGGEAELNEFVTKTLEIRESSTNASEGFLELTANLLQFQTAILTGRAEIEEQQAVLDNFAVAMEDAGETVNKTIDPIQKMIEALQKQVETYGMGSTAIAVYEARLQGANQEQQEQIALLAGEIELRELATKALEDETRAREERQKASEAAQNLIKREANLLASPIDQINQGYVERIEALRQALETEGIMQTEHNQLMIDLERSRVNAIAEHEKELYDKQMQLTQARFQAAGQLAGALAGVFEEGTAAQRAALAVQKGLAVGEAIMNMHRAISSANTAPWPTNALAIAQAASTGLSAIAGIKAASFEGGGFTGYGARAGGIDGRGGMPAIVHPNETIVDHTMGGGGVNVNITIQANDTRGFDELLNKRRGMIASMVQSSLNNMGRSI